MPARASLGMRLRIVVDDGLNALLLIAGKIEIAHLARPMLLESSFAGHVLVLRVRGRRLALLSVGADRQRNGSGENTRGQEVDLHGLDLIPSAARTRERRIRT